MEADHRRSDPSGPADVVFVGLFALYTAGLVFWLLVGLGPALARLFPAFKNTLEAWGLGTNGIADLSRRIADASRATYAGQGPVALQYLFSALNLGLGVFLIWARPRDRVARLLAVGMIGTAGAFNLPSHSVFDVIGETGITNTLHVVFHIVSGVAYMYAVALFPDGRFLPRWSKGPLLALSALVAMGGPFLVLRGAFVIQFVVFFGLLIPIVGVTAQTYRYRYAATPGERQQARLLRWALMPAFAGGLLFLIVSTVPNITQPTDLLERMKDLVVRWFPLAFAVIPVALFVDIVRYGLWDIHVVISKAVMFGVLGAFITAVYVLAVVVIGTVIGGWPGGRTSIDVATLVATAVVAVAFHPVRERVKRFANRLVYGQPATPYEVVTDFSRRMSESLSIEEILPRMAEAAANGVRAERARVRVFLTDGSVRSVSWPLGATEDEYDRTLDIVHQGEFVGDVWVAKPPGERLTQAEEALLADLASEAGLALRNVRLTVELQARLEEISAQTRELRASRQRIVAAQDTERRRLERDIHDGAQQQLVALAVKLGMARKLAAGEPGNVEEMLAQLEADAHESLKTVRDLARGIYPPALADRGLGPALMEQARKTSLSVVIEPVRIGRYPQEIEAAVYFCCLEALQNAAKHASSTRVVMRLEDGGEELTFSVSDDGEGFDAAGTPHGSGLQNMADRLAALGGALDVYSMPKRGTRVVGRLPVRPSADVVVNEATAGRAGTIARRV